MIQSLQIVIRNEISLIRRKNVGIPDDWSRTLLSLTELIVFGCWLGSNNPFLFRYSDTGRIKFDDFVACAIRLRMLTDSFRRHDTTQTGHANFQYDMFIQTVMFS